MSGKLVVQSLSTPMSAAFHIKPTYHVSGHARIELEGQNNAQTNSSHASSSGGQHFAWKVSEHVFSKREERSKACVQQKTCADRTYGLRRWRGKTQ
jgi:hypothetical protein